MYIFCCFGVFSPKIDFVPLYWFLPVITCGTVVKALYSTVLNESLWHIPVQVICLSVM